MSETEAVLGPFRKAIRREGFDWYFPIPVFLGDGKVWNKFDHGSILGTGQWLWLRDMRNPLTYVGKKHWHVELNPESPIRFELCPGDEILMPHVHHVCIRTIKDEKFAMLLIDQPFTFTFRRQIEDGAPVEESVSVNSDRAAETMVAGSKNLLFTRPSGKIVGAGGVCFPTRSKSSR